MMQPLELKDHYLSKKNTSMECKRPGHMCVQIFIEKWYTHNDFLLFVYFFNDFLLIQG